MLKNLYLDTNILKSLNFNVHEDPRLGNLKIKLTPLKIGIFAPKIVLQELLFLRRKELEEIFYSLNTSARKISRFVKRSLQIDTLDKEKLVKEMGDNLFSNIKKAGIQIFETPYNEMDLQKVTKQAIYEQRPFQEHDKGFKDAIIMHSILQHSKKVPNYEHIFLSTDKTAFDNEDIVKLIKNADVKLKLIFSIEDLNKYLDDFLDQILKSYIAKKEKTVKSFLLSNTSEIIDFIKKEGNFSESFLKEKLFLTISIEKINNAQLLDIVDPVAGVLQTDEGDVEISFTAKVEFFVLSKRYVYKRPRFKVGEEPSALPPLPMLTDQPRAVLKEIVIPKEVSVKGQVHVKKHNSTDEYSNLRLEEVQEKGSSLLATLLEEYE